MAISKATLSSKLQTHLSSGVTITNSSEFIAYCDGLAQSIVDEIQANAVVSASGPDTSGGTATVTGTVS